MLLPNTPLILKKQVVLKYCCLQNPQAHEDISALFFWTIVSESIFPSVFLKTVFKHMVNISTHGIPLWLISIEIFKNYSFPKSWLIVIFTILAITIGVVVNWRFSKNFWIYSLIIFFFFVFFWDKSDHQNFFMRCMFNSPCIKAVKRQLSCLIGQGSSRPFFHALEPNMDDLPSLLLSR